MIKNDEGYLDFVPVEDFEGIYDKLPQN